MPLRWNEPFADPTLRTRSDLNPFIDQLKEGAESGELPIVFGPKLEGMPSRWRAHLAVAETAPLIVEIGCHKGVVLTELAARFPQKACIGVDITFKRVVTTATRLKEQKLANATTVLANARGLDAYFGLAEIDGLIIFFPDPWPKKRHAKNRLLASEFCEQAKNVLRPNGFLWLKTDQHSYFLEAEAAMERAGFVLDSSGTDFLGAPLVSSFESRFRKEGLPTYGGIWRKPLENIKNLQIQ